jgi:hypothetical protein
MAVWTKGGMRATRSLPAKRDRGRAPFKTAQPPRERSLLHTGCRYGCRSDDYCTVMLVEVGGTFGARVLALIVVVPVATAVTVTSTLV